MVVVSWRMRASFAGSLSGGLALPGGRLLIAEVLDLLEEIRLAVDERAGGAGGPDGGRHGDLLAGRIEVAYCVAESWRLTSRGRMVAYETGPFTPAPWPAEPASRAANVRR
jgi:hypothetical protein